MKFSSFVIKRHLAGSLVILLAAAFASAGAAAQQPAPASSHAGASEQAQNDLAAASQPQNSSTPAANGAQSGSQNAQSDNPQPSNPQPSNAQPSNAQTGSAPAVGTAAAPYEKPMGVTASRPAGAVIAPAKQRRVRSILIKIGVVVGAGVAIGTVAALSHASPSQPH
jgi:hypothetical protein